MDRWTGLERKEKDKDKVEGRNFPDSVKIKSINQSRKESVNTKKMLYIPLPRYSIRVSKRVHNGPETSTKRTGICKYLHMLTYLFSRREEVLTMEIDRY